MAEIAFRLDDGLALAVGQARAGGRPGQAGASAGARASVSERSMDADLPAVTSTGAERALCCSPPIACTTYLPAGSRLFAYLPSAWLMTMKLRRRSAFFI